jgi:hypothetical protein
MGSKRKVRKENSCYLFVLCVNNRRSNYTSEFHLEGAQCLSEGFSWFYSFGPSKCSDVR